MWLINTKTLELEEVSECPHDTFAILSHTWGLNAEELTFNEFRAGVGREKVGFRKIRACCEQAQKDNLQYAWVDTCCIDKSSSTELSEAINSMFEWYTRAKICYVYLADVHHDGPPSGPGKFRPFMRSRWFTRGWTLQELIAPEIVSFYTGDWTWIGDKLDLASDLQVVTGIPVDVLTSRKHFLDYSLAQRMSWASKRATTRIEDGAYCLIGLFNVNMPLLYGEGPKAFLRLQEIIIGQTDDETIFAWTGVPDSGGGLLAPSAAHFIDAASIHRGNHYRERPPYTKTNRGWSLECQVYPCAMNVYVSPLQCTKEITDSKAVQIAIFICRTNKEHQYRRIPFSGRSIGTIVDNQISAAKVLQVFVPDDGRGIELLPHSGLPCINVGSNLRCWRVLGTEAEVPHSERNETIQMADRDLESGFSGRHENSYELSSGSGARGSMKTMQIQFQPRDLERGALIIFERPAAFGAWFYHYLQIGFDIDFSPVCALHRTSFLRSRHGGAADQQKYMFDRLKASVLRRNTSTTSLWKLNSQHFGSFERWGVSGRSFMWVFKGDRTHGLEETIEDIIALNYGCTNVKLSLRPQQGLVWDLKFWENFHPGCHCYGVFCRRRWSQIYTRMTFRLLKWGPPILATSVQGYIVVFYSAQRSFGAVWRNLPEQLVKWILGVAAFVLGWLYLFVMFSSLAGRLRSAIYDSPADTPNDWFGFPKRRRSKQQASKIRS